MFSRLKKLAADWGEYRRQERDRHRYEIGHKYATRLLNDGVPYFVVMLETSSHFLFSRPGLGKECQYMRGAQEAIQERMRRDSELTPAERITSMSTTNQRSSK